MDWHDQPAESPPDTRAVTGVRRGLLTAILAVGLLGIGGVAAVMAASPDPGASSAPNATQQPSGSGGTTAPSTRPGHMRGNCPNMGGSSGSGSSGSSGSPSGTPNGVATPST